MDEGARRETVDLFRKGRFDVLVATDVAARGVDLPLLDCVIHYDFPSEPRLMIHRSGRVARAGRPGTAYAFVCEEEVAFLLDTLLFLPRKLKLSLEPNETYSDHDTIVATIPSQVLSIDRVKNAMTRINGDGIVECAERAYSKYFKSCPKPSRHSQERAQSLPYDLEPHPLLEVRGYLNSTKEFKNNREAIMSMVGEDTRLIPMEVVQDFEDAHRRFEEKEERSKFVREFNWRDRSKSKEFEMANRPEFDPVYDMKDMVDGSQIDFSALLKGELKRIKAPEESGKDTGPILNLLNDDPRDRSRNEGKGAEASFHADGTRRKYVEVWNSKRKRYVKRPITDKLTKENYAPTLFPEWKSKRDKRLSKGVRPTAPEAQKVPSERSESGAKSQARGGSTLGKKGRKKAILMAMQKHAENRKARRLELRKGRKTFKIDGKKHRRPGVGNRRHKKEKEGKKRRTMRPRVRKGKLSKATSTNRKRRQMF